MDFKEFRMLKESYLDLFSDSDKAKYADEVYRLLQLSYDNIGGLKGTGFNSPQDMIKNIKFWKCINFI